MTTTLPASTLTEQQLDRIEGSGYARDAAFAAGSFAGELLFRTNEVLEFTEDSMRGAMEAGQETVEDALQGFVDGVRSGMNGGSAQ